MWWDVFKTSFKPNFNVIVAMVVIASLVGSSVAIALSVQHWRESFQQLQDLKEEKKALEIEWGQLLLEQNSWGSYARIEQMAQEQQMQPTTVNSVVMVQP
ncbi:MAG TPA: cell division protein FtsL [Agitococcus sp.]|nr:cell division protein FtsL [Agitococcus sp.]